MWLGVSIKTSTYFIRLAHLEDTPCQVRFISCEPLLADLGHLALRPDRVHWVIVGAESGPRARPMQPDWVRSIRDQYHDADVPFFFKQWCGPRTSSCGRLLDGRTWDQMPIASKVNSLPDDSSDREIAHRHRPVQPAAHGVTSTTASTVSNQAPGDPQPPDAPPAFPVHRFGSFKTPIALPTPRHPRPRARPPPPFVPRISDGSPGAS